MQQATKQPAVLLVHDYYQVPGGEDVVVANEKHLLETHGHAAALYARRNEEISRMGALEKIRSALGMFFSIRTYREVRKSIKINLKYWHTPILLQIFITDMDLMNWQ